ncbi:hypothetical protein KAU11_05825 [Candidatus Babeliales bacterium]|nr:hypothetical protein [Candidatus Babeliales bacterium]
MSFSLMLAIFCGLCTKQASSTETTLSPLEFNILWKNPNEKLNKMCKNGITQLITPIPKYMKNVPILKNPKIQITTGLRSDSVNDDFNGLIGSGLNLASSLFITNKINETLKTNIAEAITRSPEDFINTFKYTNTAINDFSPKQQKQVLKNLQKWLSQNGACKGITPFASIAHHLTTHFTNKMLPDFISDDGGTSVGQYPLTSRNAIIKFTLPIHELAIFALQPSWAKKVGVIRTIPRIISSLSLHTYKILTPELTIVALKWLISKSRTKTQIQKSDHIIQTTISNKKESLFSKMINPKILIPIKTIASFAVKLTHHSIGTALSAIFIKSHIKSQLFKIATLMAKNPKQMQLILETAKIGSTNLQDQQSLEKRIGAMLTNVICIEKQHCKIAVKNNIKSRTQ